MAVLCAYNHTIERCQSFFQFEPGKAAAAGSVDTGRVFYHQPLVPTIAGSLKSLIDFAG